MEWGPIVEGDDRDGVHDQTASSDVGRISPALRLGRMRFGFLSEILRLLSNAGFRRNLPNARYDSFRVFLGLAKLVNQSCNTIVNALNSGTSIGIQALKVRRPMH